MVKPITDNDAAILTISVNPAIILEDGGQTTATVTRNTESTDALTVQLSSDSNRVQVPSSVTFPAGSLSTTVTATGVDDLMLNSDSTVTLTVFGADFISGTADIQLIDDAPPTLAALENLIVPLPLIEQTVSLSGISPGSSQNVRITALSSNLAIVPSVTVNYFGGAIGSLTFTLTSEFATNSSVISVTVENDGLDGDFSTADDNRLVTREFVVAIAQSPVVDTAALDPAPTDLELRRAADQLELLINNTVVSTWFYESVGPLTIQGSVDNNRLLLNYAGGNPVPVAGLTYSGGDQLQTGGDSLEFSNGSATEIAHRFVDANSGLVEVDSFSINYDGLESILDTLTADTRVFEFASTDDVVTVADDGNIFNGIARISSAGTSVSVDFAIPANLLFIDLGIGNDKATIENLESNPTTLAVQGNSGNDQITGSDADEILMGGSGKDVLSGGAGNDFLLGAGTSGDQLSGGLGDDFIDGGAGNDIIIEQGDVNFTLLTTSLSGLGNDTLKRIERANLTGGSSANVLDASGFLTGFGVTLSGLEGPRSVGRFDRLRRADWWLWQRYGSWRRRQRWDSGPSRGRSSVR
jgi:Ca2+-binding RTX toxin-like protein